MTDSGILSQPRFEILPTSGVEEQADHYCDIVGPHLYTFNQVEGTERWRQRIFGPKKASGTGAPR